MRRSMRMGVAIALLGAVAAGCSEAMAPVEEDRLELSGGDDQEAVTPFGGGHLIIGWGWMPDSLRVRLTDSKGAPLPGRSVTWSTTAGSVSPAISTTNAEGEASAQWSFHSPSTGWAPIGLHQVQALVPGSPSVTFRGHARAGVTIKSIDFTPDPVNVDQGAAPVSVAIRLSDDRRDAAMERVAVQLYNPSATSTNFQSMVADLALSSGTASNGEWTGSFTVPADAERGAWSLGRITFSWGCGGVNRATLLDDRLQELGLTHQLQVIAGSGGTPTSGAAWEGSPDRKDAAKTGASC